MEIFKVDNKKQEKFLRTKTKPFSFSRYSKKELRELIKNMRKTMKEADGIGLSANQVGISESFFIAEVDSKFYAVFNPKIEKVSEATSEMEEGCLSIPHTFGSVTRPEKIIISGLNINGKKVKIKAWGLLAKVFQHEIDHLNGKLFTDKAVEIHYSN